MQFQVFLKLAFQNESRVREHRTLKISLPKHIRLEMNGLR